MLERGARLGLLWRVPTCAPGGLRGGLATTRR